MCYNKLKKPGMVLLLCCALATGTNAQVKTAAPEGAVPVTPVFTFVEQMPEFPGGVQSLYKFLSEQLKYPAAARADLIEGRVVMRFIIDTNGAVTEPTVERGVDKALDEEALRVISIMPHWKPGKNNGVAVKVYYRLPVSFRLEKDIEKPEK